jgi:Cu2+-exporting ATPase
MMCAHCEARVKKALEELPFVDEAITSHENGTAKLTLSGALDEKAVKKR